MSRVFRRRRCFFLYIYVLLFSALFLTAASSLSSPRGESSAMETDGKIVIMLDPGHGGRDSGTGEGSREEAYYTLKVARYCKAALDADGRFETYLTRNDGSLGKTESLSLMERAMRANEKNADLLISCHFDGSENSSAAGLSAYVSVVPKYSKPDLAGSILTKLNAATGLGIFKQGVNAVRDHGDKLYYWSDELNWSLPNLPETGPLRDYYGVIKWCAYFGIPSIIVEHGFLSNPGNRAIIEKEETLKALGEADAAAIIEYYTNHTHTFAASSRDFPSNCMMQGKDSQRCTICGCRKNTVLRSSSETHIWLESGRKAPGCDVEGYIEYTCEITRAMNVGKEGWCENHTYKETLPALGHAYTVTASSPSGHVKDGFNTYTCSRCGKSYTETLPGEPHSFGQAETLQPSCEGAGEYLSRCTVCGEEKREPFAPALGHDDTLSSETPPSCEDAGERCFRCTRCGRERKEQIPAIGHSEGEPYLKASTCKAEGQRGYVCAACGKEITLEILPVLPHEEEVTEEILPRCEEAGRRRYRCTVCGETREETLPALGHTLREETLRLTEGSCTEDATVTGICDRCKKEVTEVTADAPGHTEGKPFLTEPTCEEDGAQGYVCSVCGERVVLRTFPAGGHKYEEKKDGETAPTCEDEGKRVWECTVCGRRKEETLPALVHDFSGEEGKCVFCGRTEAEISDGTGGTAEGENPSGIGSYLRAHPWMVALLFGGFILFSGGIVLFFTGKKVGGILKKIRDDELAAEAEEEKDADKAEAELAAAETATETAAAEAETAVTLEAAEDAPTVAGEEADGSGEEEPQPESEIPETAERTPETVSK